VNPLPVWVEKKGGLEFSCTQCGDCCSGAPGYVWMEVAEIDRMAAHLGLARDAFGRRFLRRVGERYSLIERADGDCCFFERGKGCSVYEARPVQCRTYPFWPEVIASRETWRNESQRCAGIRKGGRLFAPAEVQALVAGEGGT